MLKQELTKTKKQRDDIGKKLDAFVKSGITPEQTAEFNELCKQEFSLSLKLRLLDRQPGDARGFLPPRMQRTVKVNLSITKKPL